MKSSADVPGPRAAFSAKRNWDMSLLHSVVYCEENVIVWGGRERLGAGGGWGAVGRSVGRSVGRGASGGRAADGTVRPVPGISILTDQTSKRAFRSHGS